MDRDSTTLLLFALLVLGGTAVTRHAPDGAGETATENAAERKEAESGYGSPETAAVDLIGRFFESIDPTDHNAGLNAGAKYWWSVGDRSANVSLNATVVSDHDDLARSLPRLRKLRDLSERKKFDVEFMIATVPDPIDSHVGWEMDPIIDSIQRAFEANGFVLDRSYFPWQGDAPKTIAPNKLALPIHARNPGVVLFRSATVVPSPEDLDVTKFHNPKLHVVLLVGETPTRGIHKIALARALDMVAAWDWGAAKKFRIPPRIKTAVLHPLAPLADVLKEATTLRVKILGPSFSGSSMSMRHALEEWVSGQSGIKAIPAQKWSSIEFQIVSGSAQDPRNKPTLQFMLAKAHKKSEDDWRADEMRSTFHGTMVPSKAFDKCVFTNYLEARNEVDRRQIALLVEANTAFGEQVTKGGSDNPKDNELKPKHDELKPEEGSPEQQPIVLQYPMQIGRMRAAYERDRALLPKEHRAEQGPPRSHLELRLKENPTANDLLPTFSPFTETSVAAVLEDMLAALGRSGIRYLGIIGTDPMDILFLARLAHRSCPDAQLFATQADLLFTHADYRLYTDGMLIFSPYPMFIKSQEWMPHETRKRMRRQFSDSWAAPGTFNAICSLLPPEGMHQSVDYAFPFDLQSKVIKPAVWCLVVSNGQFWPVECYAWDKNKSDQSRESYNDAVDTLIKDDYVSLLHRKNPKWSGSKLRTSAQKLWDEESKHYSFDGGTNYLLPGELPSSVKQEPRRAHLAELALGLDGFLGFVSLLTSALCVVNCGQYFAGVWPFRREGPFERWSLFYTPASVERCPIAAQAICFRFYFFVMLWLMQLAVMSPLLAGTCFSIDWTNGLHPRHRCILVNELSALFALTCVILIESLVAGTKKPLPAVTLNELISALPRWPTLLGLLLVASAAYMIAWLCDLCWLSGPFWFIVVALSLPLGILFGRGLLALWRYTAKPKSKWRAILAFFFAAFGTCLFVCLCGLCWLLYPFVFLAVAVPMLIGKLVMNGVLVPWLDKTKLRLFLSIVGVIILIAVFDSLAVFYFGREHNGDRKDAVRLAMYTERAGNLASGVSPIPPALCVFGGIALVVVCHLRRIRWLCWRPIESPIPARKSLELAAIYKQIEELSEKLHHPPVAWFGWLPLLLVASIGSLVVFAWPRETFETQLFKWFIRAGLLALLGVITVTWFQTLAVWDCMRELLRRLAWHPMATAYVRLPGVLKRKFRAQLFSAVPTDIESELPLQQWEYLRHEMREALKVKPYDERLRSLYEKKKQMHLWAGSDPSAHEAFNELLIAETILTAQRCNQPSKDQELEQRKVIAFWACDRSRFLADWLEAWWETRRERSIEPREKKKGKPKDAAERDDRLCEKAEEFVAIQLALVVRSVLAHLKNYLGTSVAAVLLLLGMLNSYPFQPHRMLLVVGWAIGLFIVGTALWIFAACNRDEALSRMSGLHPNKIDWDRQFILAVVSYGVVPVLVLLSMQFPEFGSYVYSPLEFVSKVLK